MQSRSRWTIGVCLFATALAVSAGDRASAQPPAVPPAGAEPAEESPLLLEPRSAEDLFDATVLMTRLARPALARRYLEGFAATNPDDELLLRMREKHGPAVFLRLSNVRELRPLSTNLLNRVNDILRTRTEDPRYIDAMVEDLFASPQEREDALRALRNIGAPAVPRLLRRVQGTGDTGEQAQLIDAIVRIGEPAVGPLAAALSAPDDRTRGAAITAMGLIGSPRAIPFLWHPAFAQDQPAGIRTSARAALARLLRTPESRIPQLSAVGVAAELTKQAGEHLRNEYPWTVADDGQVDLWTWIPQQETVGLVRVSPPTASLYTGSQLARQALSLAPVEQDSQALFLALALGADAHRAGWDQPLPMGPGTAYNLALTAGEQAVSAALALSLNSANPAAAVAALRVLGQVATRDQLYKRGSADAPIIAALSYPDDNVQFAAAAAVLQLDPDRAFPGAHRVVSILSRALRSGGTAGAVVIDPNVQRAATTAALLREMGYQPEVAPTGQEGFELAASKMDVELIAIHLMSPQWPLSQTVANLRADARTSPIPIFVYGPDDMESRLTTILREYPLVTYVTESTTLDHMQVQVQPFVQRFHSPLSPQQRKARQGTAAYWLAHLAAGLRSAVFDLRAAEAALLEGLADAELSRNAIVALGAIPTHAAQQALQEVAVNPQSAPERASIAALQLAFHIQRFGWLLDKTHLAEIEAVWRGTGDAELATSLASVMGSLRPNARLIAERLQAYPPPQLALP